MTNNITSCRFSVNTWQHLYALQHAVRHADNLSANRLVIEGVIRNEKIFERRDTVIRIAFLQTAAPQYTATTDNQLILSQLLRTDSLNADIAVDAQVFAELKRNLIEYTGIEGIHIVVTIGLHLPEPGWPKNTSADIVQLDYAMKGDG